MFLNVLKWLLPNAFILGLFMYGHLFNAAIAFNIGYFFLWATAVIGTLALFIPIERLREIVKEKEKENDYFPYKRTLDGIIDIVTLSTIVAFGFWVLGIFYFLSIVAAQNILQLAEDQYYEE